MASTTPKIDGVKSSEPKSNKRRNFKIPGSLRLYRIIFLDKNRDYIFIQNKLTLNPQLDLYFVLINLRLQL